MLLNNIFVHHVHFWLKDKADLPTFIKGLHTLSGIRYVKQIHIGVPADTHRDVVERSYDASLLIFFDDPAAQEAYQTDPIHDEFVDNYVKPYCAKVVVTDAVNA